MSDNSEESKEINYKSEGINLVTPNEPVISVRIILKCRNCGDIRKFRNEFTADKMDLVFVTIKILDWMSCEKCGGLFEIDVEYTI